MRTQKNQNVGGNNTHLNHMCNGVGFDWFGLYPDKATWWVRKTNLKKPFWSLHDVTCFSIQCMMQGDISIIKCSKLYRWLQSPFHVNNNGFIILFTHELNWYLFCHLIYGITCKRITRKIDSYKWYISYLAILHIAAFNVIARSNIWFVYDIW